jgi:hypothetical protein
MKFVVIALSLALPSLAFAQSGDPAASSAGQPKMSNPSGSGTSTSGGRDDNADQGRDKMGTTGISTQKNGPTSNEPAQKGVTGQQKSGTNAEGRAKP